MRDAQILFSWFLIAACLLAVGATLRDIFVGSKFATDEGRSAPQDPGPSQSVRETSERKLAAVEYTASVEMAVYESQLFWTIVTAFILALTILAIVLGIPADHFIYAAGRVFVALVGLAIISVWNEAMDRSAAYHDLRVFQARELEADLGFSLLTRGNAFAKGREIRFGRDKATPHRGRMKLKATAQWLANAFRVLFVGLLLLNLVRAIQLARAA